MPQLACASGGESKAKVACETAALPLSSGADDAGVVHCGNVPTSGVDAAGCTAESVPPRVRDGNGVRFMELFGAALRRDGSTKGSSNPKAVPREGALPRAAGSRRTPPAGKRAAVVVAVLAAGKVVVRKESRGWRRPAAGARVFASEIEAVGAAAEPGSPKVSCFGAVRSEKRQREEEGRVECWASVTAAVRALSWNNDVPRAQSEPEEAGESSSGSVPATAESPTDANLSPPPRPVMGLGDVKRLASRRWGEAAAGEGPVLV